MCIVMVSCDSRRLQAMLACVSAGSACLQACARMHLLHASADSACLQVLATMRSGAWR
jgi:hypothetical protein